MPVSTRRLVPWLLATLAVAAIVHLASLYAIPPIVMAQVTAQMGTPNTIHQGTRPDASSRTVVRPSTDLLYSLCPYDLSRGALLVTSPVPRGTYWSVSVYDADTNNYFVRDDRELRGSLRLVIYAPGSAMRAGNGDGVISPTRHGIVIFRTLIDSEAHIAALDAERRQASCTPVR
jgi:uncharacterized membrane protein